MSAPNFMFGSLLSTELMDKNFPSFYDHLQIEISHEWTQMSTKNKNFAYSYEIISKYVDIPQCYFITCDTEVRPVGQDLNKNCPTRRTWLEKKIVPSQNFKMSY